MKALLLVTGLFLCTQVASSQITAYEARNWLVAQGLSGPYFQEQVSDDEFTFHFGEARSDTFAILNEDLEKGLTSVAITLNNLPSSVVDTLPGFLWDFLEFADPAAIAQTKYLLADTGREDGQKRMAFETRSGYYLVGLHPSKGLFSLTFIAVYFD